MKRWLFSRTKEPLATQASIEQLMQRLDDKDEQLQRMEQAMNRQSNQIEKLIKRIDRATGREVA